MHPYTASTAAQRFGFGEPDLQPMAGDPLGWVRAQLHPAAAAPKRPADLMGSGEALRLTRRALLAAAARGEQAQALAQARQQGLRATMADLQWRWQLAAAGPRPVCERLVQFWSNHFTVSAARVVVSGLVWPFEREAIRPHALGRFEDLLRATTLHPAMLLYLDNASSVGPNSRAGQRRDKGLNENLARELLELHTVGVGAGYSQRDVTEAARVLTGWRPARMGDDAEVVFDSALHEPGSKTVLGRGYPEGRTGLDRLLADLARHPATAQFLATKLARHFVSDEPPAALVDAVALRYRASDGDLAATSRALFEHPLAWQPAAVKFKRPEDLVLSAHRVTALPIERPGLLLTGMAAMGQPVGRAPSPQGWPERVADWSGPDALLKRIEWAAALAERGGRGIDARTLAEQASGATLDAATRREIERAESGSQALAVWLASPSFQWR